MTGASFDSLDRNGRTLLHIAVGVNSLDVGFICKFIGERYNELHLVAEEACGESLYLYGILHQSAEPKMEQPSLRITALDVRFLAMSEPSLKLAGLKKELPSLRITALTVRFSAILELLLQSTWRIDVNAVTEGGIHALSIAVVENNPTAVRLLCQAKANPNQTIPKDPSYTESAKLFGRLFLWPERFGRDQYYKQSCKYDADIAMKGQTPLGLAAVKGYDSIVHLLLEAEANVDTRHGDMQVTPLWMAAERGHVDIVQRLLDAGAKVDFIDTKDRSALCQAANLGHREIVSMLIRAGADVNLNGDHGLVTPLWIAAAAGHSDIVQLLFDSGAQINETNVKGLSPLGYVAIRGDEVMAQLLVKLGADVNVRTSEGRTPLGIALEYGFHGIAELLKEHGGVE